LRGIDVVRLPTSRHVVALTFDAGGNAAGVPRILAALEQTGVRGTFFLTGSWTRSFPNEARAIAGRYPVGNHSMTHPHFNALDDAAIRAQLVNARALVRSTTGHDPYPLFRFPYGERDPHNRTLVNDMGYVSIFWTVDTLGWQGTSGGRSEKSVEQRVLAQLQPGEIVLMHLGSNPLDGSTLDADALLNVIAAIKAAGYGFTTIGEALPTT
jgi:peptidoglycan/xylan/chitin deacetylase (PgdA/CDA1 family)